MTQPNINFEKLGYLVGFLFPGAGPWAGVFMVHPHQSAIDPPWLMVAGQPPGSPPTPHHHSPAPTNSWGTTLD